MKFTEIKSENEYLEALERLYDIFLAQEGDADYDELISLTDLVEAYEDIHYPIDLDNLNNNDVTR